MKKITLSILSLLARMPLSGYDLKKQINEKIEVVVKVNNNQIYPQLRKLESDGQIKLKEVKNDGQHPARKIYEITEKGIETIKEQITFLANQEDKLSLSFVLYNSWLLDSEVLLKDIELKREEYEKKLAILDQKIANLKKKKITKQNRASLDLLNYQKQIALSNVEYCKSLEDNISSDND